MKAAVVTEIGKLEVIDIPMPEVGDYDVLCDMKYGATCAGTDIHLMDGKHPFPVSFPTVLGHESVGRVVEVGKKVRNFKIGDLVSRVGWPGMPEKGIYSNWGGFAEFGIARDHWEMRKDGMPEASWQRNRVNQIIHPSISEKEAPMMITWRETLSYLKRIGVKAGDKVIVIGSGANALSATTHAYNMGAEVLVVGSLSKDSFYHNLDLTGYMNYKSEDLQAEIEDRFGAQKYDYIFDFVGSSRTMNQLLALLKPNGTIGVYGWDDRKAYGINPFVAANSFHVYQGGYDEEETHGDVEKWILCGKLKAENWYDMEHPVELEQIKDAYDSLRRHERMKYLIRL